MSLLVPVVALVACLAEGAEPAGGTFDRRFFGMHIHQPEKVAWPTTQLGTWRLWDAGISWADMEPQLGRYDFTKLDRYLDLAKQKDVEVLLPVALTPRWASSRPDEAAAYAQGSAAPPSDLAHWERFVNRLVQHTSGRVRAYELWNEANIAAFYSGDVRSLVQMARILRVAVDTYAPGALVVGPSGAGLLDQRRQFLAQFVLNGGGQWVDVLAFHLYTGPHPPEVMVGPLGDLLAVARSAGNKGSPLALWNTESGYQVKPGNGMRGSTHQDALPAPLAAAYLVRAHVIARSMGVEQFDTYAWDNGSYPLTLDDRRTLNDVGAAYAAMTNLLIGATLRECAIERKGVCVCSLTSAARGAFRLAWSSGNTPVEWRPGNSVRVESLAGQLIHSAIESVSLAEMPLVLTTIEAPAPLKR